MRNKGGQEDGMSYVWYGSRSLAIDILLLFNFSVVFEFNVFPIPPSKAKLISYRRNAASCLLRFLLLTKNSHNYLYFCFKGIYPERLYGIKILIPRDRKSHTWAPLTQDHSVNH
jgi:hypothetical protein